MWHCHIILHLASLSTWTHVLPYLDPAPRLAMALKRNNITVNVTYFIHFLVRVWVWRSYFLEICQSCTKFSCNGTEDVANMLVNIKTEMFRSFCILIKRTTLMCEILLQCYLTGKFNASLKLRVIKLTFCFSRQVLFPFFMIISKEVANAQQ